MYVQLYILIDALIEPDTNADINVSSSAGDTAQNGRTAAVTSNAESEVPSTNQGMYGTLQQNVFTKFTNVRKQFMMVCELFMNLYYI